MYLHQSWKNFHFEIKCVNFFLMFLSYRLNLILCIIMSTKYHTNTMDSVIVIGINHISFIGEVHSIGWKNIKIAFKYNNTFYFDKSKIKKNFLESWHWQMYNNDCSSGDIPPIIYGLHYWNEFTRYFSFFFLSNHCHFF